VCEEIDEQAALGVRMKEKAEEFVASGEGDLSITAPRKMSDKEEFEFGHFDRQEHFFKAFKPFLLHLPELQEAFDLVIGNIANHADDLPKRIIFCLGRMAWEDLNEIFLSCANGFNSGGYKVLRPMFEHVLYVNHFSLHPEDSDRFWDYNSADRYKVMRQITIEYPNAFPDEQFRAAKTAYEALGDSFKVPVCRECRPIRCLECNAETECQRCKKTKDHFTWTERDIVSMAREQEIDIMILTGIYYFAMQETHPKVISIVNRLESGDEGSYGFMGREVGEVLGEISEDEVAAGRPMLSSVAVGVNGKPGPGFYVLAHRLGFLSTKDEDVSFWEDQCIASYKAWRRPLPPATKTP